MKIKTVRKSDLAGTSRHLKNDVYETFRFLLAEDKAGLTLTDILLAPGIEEVYGYERHIEIAYCLEGSAQIHDMSDGTLHKVEPGVLWVAPMGSRFKFVAYEPTRLICAFTPPFVGHETGFVGAQ